MTSFSQREPLTTRIRGLLEEYPVGTGILKEALQNSDDSGARTQIFLLDRMSYPVTDLFDPELKRYQGPSLILQNDTQFQESDFESLSRLGESGKREDIAKTGKFGLGFNSTYNLTDAPMILTGDQFVVLEPHEEISQPRFKGGFRETFLNQKLPQNQLKPFEQLVSNGFEKPFYGTIIRLPLRTKEDAARSKISNKEVSPESIMEIFDAFKSEAVESLLFLKNIEKIEVYETSSLNTRKQLFSLEILDAANIRNARSELVKALQSCAVQSKIEKSCIMEMKVSMTDYSISKTCQTHWLIRHEVNNNHSMNTEENFLQEQKLLPWVGLAASLDFEKSFSGRLFTFLPLPITTSFPVHIHGIFGLTRDRRNLIQQSAEHPKDSKPDIIGKWNKELFQTLIPAAWSRLLVDLTRSYKGDNQLPYWPASTIEMQNNICRDLLTNILCRAQENRYAIFKKHRSSSESKHDSQWLPLDEALVCSPNDSIAQILTDAGMKITCIDDDIFQTLRNKKIPFSEPSPSIVRQHLRSTLVSWSSILDTLTKEKLLKYLCDDKNFSDLAGLKLIPLANGEFATFSTSQQEQKLVYLIDSENEFNLFKDWSHRLVGLNKKIFLNNIKLFKKHTNIQPWSFDAALRFLHERFFKSYLLSGDEIPGSVISINYLNKLWAWIDTQVDQGNSNSKLNSLWLIPTADGKLRRISAYPTIISKNRIPIISHEQYSIIINLLGTINVSFLHKDFTESPLMYLKSLGLIKDLSDVSNILNWLEKQSWQTVNKNEASVIRNHFYNCLVGRPIQLSNNAKEVLRKLPIFEVLTAPKQKNQDTLIELSSLIVNTPKKVIAISSKQIIPILNGIFLAYINDRRSEYLVHDILGIEKMEFNNFLVHIVIPSLPQQPEYLLDPLIKMLLQNLASILHSVQKKSLCDFPFVPCSALNGAFSSVCRRAPSELVDPHGSILTSLFLPQENIYPVGYYTNNEVLKQLQLLGMSTMLNPSLIKSRVEFFVKTWNDKMTSNELKEHIHKKSLILLKAMESFEDLSTLGDLQSDIAWLPAMTRTGERILVRSSECRCQRDKDLVSYALPIVQHKVRSKNLREFLGWNKGIGVDILQKQIIGILDDPSPPEDMILEKTFLPIFEQLEKFVSQPEQLKNLKPALDTRSWIPVKDKFWHTSETVFQDPNFSLEPYIIPLSRELKKCSPKFLKYMGIQDSINNGHMIEILKNISIRLGTTNILSEEELKLVVRIIGNLSDGELSDDIREQIFIPDKEHKLVKINDITYRDLYGDTNDQTPGYGPMANDAISIRVAKRLKIPLLSERILNDIIVDDYIEEHEQKESICTRIKNTLREYTIDSTSNEFIANADDSGATTLKWIFDPHGEYSKKSLFCDDMEVWQGPSIFCYNNGLFTEDDIKALAKVGVGSKQEDSTKIGRYGLGFLSAYHWTDVPSIVSGGSAIFFDPQKKYLPHKHDAKGSKIERLGGLHIKDIGKSKASQFSDQFAPFTGLFGFNPNEHFNGTLFRLPLRRKGIKSDIAAGNEFLDEYHVYDILTKFFRSAKKSLFFLRNMKEIEAFVFTKDRVLKPLWSVSLKEPSLDIIDMRKALTEKSNDMTLDICIKEYNRHDFIGGRIISNITERWAVFSEIVPLEKKSPLDEFAKTNRMICHIGIAAPLWTRDAFGVEETLPFNSFGILSPLPMPIPVGLPVHLYGCYALSSDRRSILLDTPSESSAKTKISWNDFLLRCTAKLYLHALTKLSTHPSRIGVYYEYWPSSKGENSVVQPLYHEFWRLILEKNEKEKPNIFETCTLNENVASRWISINEAIFCNPEESESYIRRLLLAHGNNNIVSLPPKLWRILCESNSNDIIKSVDPTLLRETIKQSSNIKMMLDSRELSHDEYVSLLKYLVSDNSLKDLIGCQILLLEDHSMATLMKQNTSEENYYTATMQELQLFDFAKNQFVSREIPKEVIDALSASSAGLNVSSITPDAIRYFLRKIIKNSRLLEYRVRGQKPDTKWIKAFWQYWDSKAISLNELADIPILPVGNPPTHLVSVNHMGELLCLQSPKNNDLRRVIQKIGRIYLINLDDLPTKSVQIQVFNLENYLDCLTKSPSAGNVCQYLTLDEKIILRNFVMESVTYTDFERMGRQSKELLRGFPLWYIWPQSNQNLYSVKNTCLLPHPNIFFRPLQHTAFLREESKYYSMFESLGVPHLQIEEHFKEYVVPNLPHRLTPDLVDTYFKFLQKLLVIQDIPSELLSRTKIAPDVNGVLHCANELFDPTVPLFHHTFILDGKDKLLHPTFRDLRSKMHRFGLRQKLDGENFIKCAEEIERNWINNPLEDRFRQAVEAFNYLNDTNTETLYFSDEEWEQLRVIHFIPTRPSSKPFFGNDLWGAESTYPRLSCFRNLIVQEKSNIAWTQRPVFGIPPSDSLLKRDNTIENPDTGCVFKHLCCLAEIRKEYTMNSDDPNDFIDDLKATYTFLERKHNDLENLFRQKIDCKLFCNYDGEIEDPFDDKFWFCAPELVINATYDISPILRRIRSSLEPYPNLLRVAGAKYIDMLDYHPLPDPDAEHRRIMLEKFYNFYQNEDLSDVEFLVVSSEGESDKISGHRVILAASSNYFKNLFSKSMAEGSRCMCSGDPIRIEGLTPRAVRHAFEFIYSGKLNKALLDEVPQSSNRIENRISPDNPDSDLYAYLLELLHVADRFQLDLMHNLVQNATIERNLIRIDTVRDLSEWAVQFNADELIKYCNKFEELNSILVAIANERGD